MRKAKVNRWFILFWRIFIVVSAIALGWWDFFSKSHAYVAGAIALAVLAISFLVTLRWERK